MSDRIRRRPRRADRADAPADAPASETTDSEPPEETEPAAPLLRLRDGLPAVVDTPGALAEAVARVAAGTGPVALDAERASGYRYSARAYLIQLRREGAGTFLIDPIPFDDLEALDGAIGDAEWILHAATQDLACLREVGLRPRRLFDTEHAARLLGYPRVGLATLTESILGHRMRKEHSAADWSTRPLPKSWLEYAALDVEMLIELRDALAVELEAAGKAEWAAQEFDWLTGFAPVVRQDPWRRMSGVHKLRSRRKIAAARELWYARDDLARARDTTAGRLLPDSAVIAAAKTMPTDRAALLRTEGFHGRAARGEADRWVAAIKRAAELAEADLPPSSLRSDGPPQARSWADRDPVAAARLATARTAMAALSEEVSTPVENLLTPDYLRRVLWEPPDTADLSAGVSAELALLGARPWQIEVTLPVILAAITDPVMPEAAPATETATEPASDPETDS